MKKFEMIKFEPLSVQHAEEAVAWAYASPYNVYNIPADRRRVILGAMLRPEYNYYAAIADGEFIGIRCFGIDAQVPGGTYSDDALDIGGGLRPDLTGQGIGRTVLLAALAFGRERFAPSAFRVTVAEFNERARRLCSAAGFSEVSRFCSTESQRFYLIMSMDAA